MGVGYGVIIDTGLNKVEASKEMTSESRIEAASGELDIKLISDIKIESLISPGIALDIAYTCLKALTGEKELVADWILKINASVNLGEPIANG